MVWELHSKLHVSIFKPLVESVPSCKINPLFSRCPLVVSPFTCPTTNNITSRVSLWTGRLKWSATLKAPSGMVAGMDLYSSLSWKKVLGMQNIRRWHILHTLHSIAPPPPTPSCNVDLNHWTWKTSEIIAFTVNIATLLGDTFKL